MRADFGRAGQCRVERARGVLPGLGRPLEGASCLSLLRPPSVLTVPYSQAKAEFADYYRSSLLYLACIDPSVDLSDEERQSRAHDLGISALLGSIYNFGELLMHPILDALVGTDGEVVRSLLLAFNKGDIAGFEALVPEIAKKEVRLLSSPLSSLFPLADLNPRLQAFLQQHFPFLREKICLLALNEAVFKRPTQDRTLPFSVISQEAQVPVDEVEHLVMKALACVSFLSSHQNCATDCLLSFPLTRTQPQAHPRHNRPSILHGLDLLGAAARPRPTANRRPSREVGRLDRQGRRAGGGREGGRGGAGGAVEWVGETSEKHSLRVGLFSRRKR